MNGVVWFLLLGLAVALIVVVRQMFRTQRARPTRGGAPPMDLANLTIRDARRNDLISVRHAGRDFEDLTFTVQKIHRYEWGNESWYELEGRAPDGRVFLEWYEDDGLHVSLTRGDDRMRIQQLNLTEEDLSRMDEEQSASNYIDYDGQRYHYESSHEVGFFEDDRGSGEGFYLWNFEADDGKSSIGIEKWEGEAFEALVGRSLDPADVTVFRS